VTAPWPGVIERYRDRFPVSTDTQVVTLLEGNTPLVPAPGLSSELGRDTFVKFDGANPTASFKDRGMTLAVTKALEAGARGVACASTGNTSASAAAYAARAGMECVVVLPAGKVAAGKLAQALMHGATVVPVDGNFDDALSLVRQLTADGQAVLVNSLNPYRIEGQQSAAWEVVDALGTAPATHALPVGNAGNITAYWKGYTAVDTSPCLWGFQAAGAAPIVSGEVVDDPDTVATAIRIGNPVSWDSAVAARDHSGGIIEAVTDDEILAAYRLLAAGDGIFGEPASAAPIAGLLKFRDRLPPGPVVATVTGHGLKDPQTAIDQVSLPEPVAPTVDAVGALLGW
jgi:threonine synthase